MAQTYEQYKAKRAGDIRALSAQGRDIGPLPVVVDAARKNRGLDSLESFGMEYFPARFFLPVSGAHREAIRQLEACTNDGGQFVCAMPRGFGKDTWAEVAVMRAILYGLRRFVVFVGATQPHAERSLKKIKSEFQTNDRLAEDFPEACHPIRSLKRITHKVNGQTLDGEPTRMEWASDMLVLPFVPGSACSGAAIQVAGLTGAIRGLTVLGPDGAPVRPDMVVVNDAQTRDSAKSPTQTADREAVVSDDILMLAGPTTTIAAVMLCTVIFRNDLSDRFLDPEKHPEWSRVRTRAVERMPERMDLWDRYAEVRREAMQSGAGVGAGNEFLSANWDEMHKGAAVSWPERVRTGELSALQGAMHTYIDNPRGFWAELQNDPQAEASAAGAKELVAASVADRCNGVERGHVPAECTRLTAFFDVGGELCWYVVCGWDERFSGAVVDYGCWPRQNRTVFEARDARPGLSEAYPGYSESQRVFAGLRDLTAAVLGRPYFRTGGGELKVERALADRGWQPDAVTKLVRASPFAGLLMPSIGIGRTTTRTGVSEWKPRPGERSGYHWRVTVGEGGRGRMTQFDADAWKTFLWERLTTPMGGAGALTLPGKSPGQHALLSEHCAAEYAEPVTIRGATFDKWQVRPTRPDNHLWDCLVGAAVAASVAGVRWEPSSPPTGPAPERQGKKGVDFAELVRRNRAARQGRR